MAEDINGIRFQNINNNSNNNNNNFDLRWYNECIDSFIVPQSWKIPAQYQTSSSSASMMLANGNIPSTAAENQYRQSVIVNTEQGFRISSNINGNGIGNLTNSAITSQSVGGSNSLMGQLLGSHGSYLNNSILNGGGSNSNNNGICGNSSNQHQDAASLLGQLLAHHHHHQSYPNNSNNINNLNNNSNSISNTINNSILNPNLVKFGYFKPEPIDDDHYVVPIGGQPSSSLSCNLENNFYNNPENNLVLPSGSSSSSSHLSLSLPSSSTTTLQQQQQSFHPQLIAELQQHYDGQSFNNTNNNSHSNINSNSNNNNNNLLTQILMNPPQSTTQNVPLSRIEDRSTSETLSSSTSTNTTTTTTATATNNIPNFSEEEDIVVNCDPNNMMMEYLLFSANSEFSNSQLQQPQSLVSNLNSNVSCQNSFNSNSSALCSTTNFNNNTKKEIGKRKNIDLSKNKSGGTDIELLKRLHSPTINNSSINNMPLQQQQQQSSPVKPRINLSNLQIGNSQTSSQSAVNQPNELLSMKLSSKILPESISAVSTSASSAAVSVPLSHSPPPPAKPTKRAYIQHQPPTKRSPTKKSPKLEPKLSNDISVISNFGNHSIPTTTTTASQSPSQMIFQECPGSKLYYNSTYKRMETDIEREQRLMNQRIRKALMRANETEEQRRLRLAKQNMFMQKRRAMATPESKRRIAEKQRVLMAKRRALGIAKRKKPATTTDPSLITITTTTSVPDSLTTDIGNLSNQSKDSKNSNDHSLSFESETDDPTSDITTTDPLDSSFSDCSQTTPLVINIP